MTQHTVCPTCDGAGTVTQDIDQHGRRYINQPVEDREHVCDDCDGTGEVAPKVEWCDFHHHYEDTAPCTCPEPTDLPFPAPVSSGEACCMAGTPLAGPGVTHEVGCTRPAATTGEALCDGCDKVTAGVVASNDGRGQFCPTCLPETNWSPGDPCSSCGSTNTTRQPDVGASCGGCHRTDADEAL